MFLGVQNAISQDESCMFLDVAYFYQNQDLRKLATAITQRTLSSLIIPANATYLSI